MNKKQKKARPSPTVPTPVNVAPPTAELKPVETRATIPAGAKWNPLRRAWCRTVNGRLVPLDPQPPPPMSISQVNQARFTIPAPKIIA